MKKIFIIITILFISLNAFSQDAILNHIPDNHQFVAHINLKKFFNSVNTDEGTKALLISLKAMFPAETYNQIEKFFNETINNLKTQGFDIFKDLEHIIISGGIGEKHFLAGVYGNFSGENYNNIIVNRFELSMHTSANGITMHTNSNKEVYSYYHSNKTILFASTDALIEESLDAIKKQKNILHNVNFRNIYNKSIKNRVINIYAAISKQQRNEGFQNQQSEQPQDGGQMAMLMMLMQSLNGINLSIDFPAPIAIDIKIFCKDPNTAVMINSLIQQQLPNLQPTINQEIQSTNREIMNLSARLKRGENEVESMLMSIRHKLCILLLISNAGNQIRSRLAGNDIIITYTWSRAILQSLIEKAGLHYDLNKILK